MVNRLNKELYDMKYAFIDEHRQIKEEYPIKIHDVAEYTDTMWHKTVEKEGDAYIVNYKMLDPVILNDYLDPLYCNVFPVLNKVKKNGEMAQQECHYVKKGTFRFWKIGEEDKVYEINFGR